MWTQEVYRPSRSKCSLCYSVSWWGGGRTPSSLASERGYPMQSWMGVPYAVLDGGTPIQSWTPIPGPSRGSSFLGWGHPIHPDMERGTPHLDLGRVTPHLVLRRGYPHLDLGRGYPLSLDGVPPPRRGVNWHTNWKYYLPHPSDAGGKNVHIYSYMCHFWF